MYDLMPAVAVAIVLLVFLMAVYTTNTSLESPIICITYSITVGFSSPKDDVVCISRHRIACYRMYQSSLPTLMDLLLVLQI